MATRVKADHRADASGISRRASEAHAQTRFGAEVVVQLCHCTVLGYHQVQSAIAIIIRDSGPTLLTVNHNTTFLAWNGAQTSFAIAL